MKLRFLVVLFFLVISCGDKVKKTVPFESKVNLELIKTISSNRLFSLVRAQSNIMLTTGFAGSIQIRALDSLKIKKIVQYDKGRVIDFVLGLSGEVVLFIDGRGRLKGFNLKNGIFLNIGDNLRQLLSIASNPVQNQIILGTRQGKLIFLDDKLKKIKTKITGLKKIKSLRFSPDGKILVVVGFRKDVLFFRSTDWKLIKRIKTAGSVTSFDFSKDGKYFAVGTIFWKVIIYRIDEWKEFTAKEINLEPVTALAFSEDGKRLYSGYGRSGKGFVAIFYGTNFSKEKVIPINDSGIIFLENQNKKVLAVTTDGSFKLYK